jgi:hypothetical protein
MTPTGHLGSGTKRCCAAAGLLACLLAAGPAAAATASPALPAPPVPDYIHTARQGDTLIGLGNRLLARPGDWRELQRLNAIANPRRIPVGTVIRIPVRLLKTVAVDGRIEQSIGSVRIAAADGRTAAVQAGAAVPEGARIDTGADGYVTVRLADGSLLRVQSASQAVLQQSRSFPAAGFFRSAWNLVSGRIEALVTQLTGGAPQFEVQTPQGVLGVRGTEFRVAADAARAETRGEVLAGEVDVSGSGKPTRVAAGFATVVDASRRVAAPVALLPAPDVSALPALHERVLVRFQVPAVAGAGAYRAQVASDREFRSVVAESVTETGQLRFTGLADQAWFLRVRAIDARQLEGRDAVHAFVLKARPEPPIVSAPPPRGKLRAAEVEFTWTRNPDAATYHFQLAREPSFAARLQERAGLQETTFTAAGLAAGEYFWRLAAVRASGDRGPWGDPASFTLGALPGLPQSAVRDTSVRFSWGAEPGQTFEFQLARDRAFSDVVAERSLAEPQLELPRPAPGTYYVRYRARDADGFVGPFTAPQVLELTRCVTDGSGNCVNAAGGALPAP